MRRVGLPADVGREDRLIGDLTARQVAILAVAAVSAYGCWQLIGPTSPMLFAAVMVPIAGVTLAIVLARRDGQSAERWLWWMLACVLGPKRMVVAGSDGVIGVPGFAGTQASRDAQPLPKPVRLTVSDAPDPSGTLPLGDHGVAGVAAASMVNFALRTEAEQTALVAAFGQWLNGLDAPVQIVIRARRLELSPMIDALRENAPQLPHPALEQAAHAHAEFLADLQQREQLLRREALVIARDPTGNPSRVEQVLAEARAMLAAGEVSLNRLDAAGAEELLADACNPSLKGGDLR